MMPFFCLASGPRAAGLLFVLVNNPIEMLCIYALTHFRIGFIFWQYNLIKIDEWYVGVSYIDCHLMLDP